MKNSHIKVGARKEISELLENPGQLLSDIQAGLYDLWQLEVYLDKLGYPHRDEDGNYIPSRERVKAALLDADYYCRQVVLKAMRQIEETNVNDAYTTLVEFLDSLE